MTQGEKSYNNQGYAERDSPSFASLLQVYNLAVWDTEYSDKEPPTIEAAASSAERAHLNLDLGYGI